MGEGGEIVTRPYLQTPGHENENATRTAGEVMARVGQIPPATIPSRVLPIRRLGLSVFFRNSPPFARLTSPVRAINDIL